jgi:hypothetical protein
VLPPNFWGDNLPDPYRKVQGDDAIDERVDTLGAVSYKPRLFASSAGSVAQLAEQWTLNP